MKIPFFNLQEKSKVKQDEEHVKDAINSIFDLIKLSTDNDKEVDKLIISRGVYYELLKNELYPWSLDKNKIAGYKFKIIPDIAVVWKKK